MARRCDLTGKDVLTGNHVSHSNIKTRRRFLPNIQNVTLASDALKQTFKFKIAVSTLRTIEHRGGFDNFLLKAKDSELSTKARRVKKSVTDALAEAS